MSLAAAAPLAANVPASSTGATVGTHIHRDI